MRTATIRFELSPEGIRANGQLVSFKKYETGIVIVENRSAGIGHSAHPNIHKSGSIEGMKKLGYWNRKDKIVEAGDYLYNVSKVVISDELDLLADGIQESKVDYLEPLALPEYMTITLDESGPKLSIEN